METKTVKIVAKQNLRCGYAIINEDDFNSEKHELFEEKEAVEQTKQEALLPPVKPEADVIVPPVPPATVAAPASAGEAPPVIQPWAKAP